MFKRSHIATAIAAFAIAGAAHANLVNAGFETGDLTGWNVNGPANVDTAFNAYTAKEGDFFLRVTSSSANAWQTVTQSFSLAAGQSLNGWAAFAWGDYAPFADGARVRVLNTAGSELGTVFYADGNGHPDYYQGPWTAWSFTAQAAGDYVLEFGARNTIDSGANSYGLFDIAETPEPTSIALLGLGVIGMAAARRRKSA